MMPNNFKQLLEDNIQQDELIEIVRTLISIPSHWDSPEREKPLAVYLNDLFQANQIDAYLQHVIDDRPNSIATLPGSGNGPSLMFNGHIDTVPSYGMCDPYGGAVKEGKLHGRGAADMKSGVGTMAYALILLKRLGIQLAGDVVFAGVIDEDAAGSAGTRHLIEHGPLTDLAIVGEPTNLKPMIAHKGIDYFKISFTGRSVHSSVPQHGVNAIYAATHFIKLVESQMVPYYEALTHKLVGAPTVNVGLIEGAAKANKPFLKGASEKFSGIVPDECDVYVDIRWTPSQKLAEVESYLEKLAAYIAESRAGITAKVEYLPWPRPAMEVKRDHSFVQALIEVVGQVLDSDVAVAGAQYWGDSGLLYGQAGIPSILFGPGSIDCAHSDNEFVALEELSLASLIYALLAIKVCGVAE